MDSDGTCKDSQVSAPSCKLVPLERATFWMLKLVNFHRCPWDINAPYYLKLISPLLINIVGQGSLDDQSIICQVSIRRNTHSSDMTVKSQIGPFCPPNPRKSIVYTCPFASVFRKRH